MSRFCMFWVLGFESGKDSGSWFPCPPPCSHVMGVVVLWEMIGLVEPDHINVLEHGPRMESFEEDSEYSGENSKKIKEMSCDPSSSTT